MLLIEEDEDDGTDYTNSDPPMSPTDEAPVEVNVQPQVSLNSVIGLSNPKTMKLRGTVQGRDVVVMIDPGATHNFVSLAVVEELGMELTATGGFGVSLGNGDAIQGTGLCKNVEIVLDGRVAITVDMLPLELGNSDIILGVQWLETLGTVVSNWKTQLMQFEDGGRTVTLFGDASLVRSKISLKAMLRTLRKEKEGYYVELNVVEKSPTEGCIGAKAELQIPEFLLHVIEQNAVVF